MTHSLFHAADSRGFVEHGWLKSWHSFSFASYHNPERMHFGALRVLNDDIIAPSAGFGTHPHDNMEIVTIPLSGALQHKDSLGNAFVIRAGEVQVMSAGTGLTHSEYNASATEPVNLLQIWVYPGQKSLPPGYDQKMFSSSERQNRWQLLASPDARAGSLKIHQNAFFSRIDLDAGTKSAYELFSAENCVYFFLITGVLTIDENLLNQRDALGLTPRQPVSVSASQNSALLAIEVPQLKMV